MKTKKKIPFYYLGFWILIFFLMVVYWPGLKGGFFFDDAANILASGSIKINDLSVDSFLNVWGSGIAGPLGRPISMLTFAANYYFSDFDPYWFKLTNLLIHTLNTLLVYCLYVLLIKSCNIKEEPAAKYHLLAVVLAALWALNPIQVTSVLYVVQRMTSLSSAFVLMGLILHIWVRQRQVWDRPSQICFAVAWALCLPMAMLSKETGVLFLLYVAAYEGVLHRNVNGSLDRFAKIYLALLSLAGVFLLFDLFFSLGPGLLQPYDIRNFTLVERLMTESRIIWAYIKMIVVPNLSDFGLYHDDFVISKGLFEPVETFVAICGLFISLVAAWLMRNKVPVVSFGIIWFFVGHSLESTIFPLELMHEHRNYLPSIGVVFLIVPALTSDKLKISTYRMLIGVCAMGLLVYFSLITYLRADMYGDNFRRTQIEAQYHIESVRSQYDAGAVLVNRYNQLNEPILAALAEKHFERVNSLDATYKLGLIGMLQIDCLSQKSAREEVYEELMSRIADSKWEPLNRTVMHGIAEMSNAGTLCLNRVQVDALFSTAIGHRSASLKDRSVLYSDYALYLWIGQNDYQSARSALVKSITEDESDILNRINLLQLVRFLGDREEVLNLLADLQTKKLSRGDQARIQRIKSELSVEGVTGGQQNEY